MISVGKNSTLFHGSKAVFWCWGYSRLSRVADVRVITSSAATCASHKITETRAPGSLRFKRDPSIVVKDNTSHHMHTLAPHASYASQLFWMILLPALISSCTKSTCCQKIHHWTVKTSKRLAKLCPAWCPHQFKSMQAGCKIIWTKIWNLRVLTRIPFSVYFPDISNSKCSLLLYTVQLNSTTQQPSNQPPARSDWIHPAIPKKKKKTHPTHFIIKTGCNILVHFGANCCCQFQGSTMVFLNAFHRGFLRQATLCGLSSWIQSRGHFPRTT